jgi:hypothetical protein
VSCISCIETGQTQSLSSPKSAFPGALNPLLEVVSMASTKLSMTAKPVEPMIEHEIRLRAYDLYERRGAGDGYALDDWLQAEYEVLRQQGAIGLTRPSERAYR